METKLPVVQGTNTQSLYNTTPNVEPASPVPQESQRENACYDPHRVYHILTNENKPQTNGKTKAEDLEMDSAELSSVYDVVAKKNLLIPKQLLYSALAHTKPKGREQPGKQEDYNTLQHAKSSRLSHSVIATPGFYSSMSLLL